MKTGINLFIGIVGFAVLCAWTIKQLSDIDNAAWLIGTWENKTPRGSIYETWSKASDNELLGKSYVVEQRDTIVFETIQLVQEPNGLFYIPTVPPHREGLDSVDAEVYIGPMKLPVTTYLTLIVPP